MRNSLKIITAIILLLLAIKVSDEAESKDVIIRKTNEEDVAIETDDESDTDADDDDSDEENMTSTQNKSKAKPKTTQKPAAKAGKQNKKKTTKGDKSDKATKKDKKDNKRKTDKTVESVKRGPKGEKGEKGEQGPKGEPGDDASANIPMQAALSTVLTEHYGPAKDKIVAFDLVLIDLGDNYDNATGIFICTIPGVYVVSLYLMSHPGAKVNSRIYINSRPIAALWADDNKNVGFYPSSSIQTVTRLEFGDQVYVMLVDGGYGESWVHANYNAFTIYLLYEDAFMKK